MKSYSRQLADFATNFKLSDVPKDVIERAKGVILDGLGCGLFASDVTWTRILAGVIRRLEPNGGQATIWGRGETASAVNAALINGTMVQAYELDDAHVYGHMHSCSVVMTAAIAAAEYVGADKVSGEKLLLAIIAGFEVGPRVSICMRGKNMALNGWHSGAIVAPFSAAIAAGIVLGLNSDQFFNALGIAGTQACGLMAVQYGSMVKRMNHAKGAQNGLYAALLAADGFTGIEDVFEQKYGGYCTTFSHSEDQFDLPALVEGLGERWETMRFTIKAYACKMPNHGPVNAVDELVRENDIKAEDVEAVTVLVPQQVVLQCGWYPFVPNGLTAAQMHTGFCIATRLIEGDVFIDEMVEENVGRADLVELANRVRVVRSIEREEKMTKNYEYRHGADVEIKLKSGKLLKKTVDFVVGSQHRPLTSEQMASKFRRLAAKALPPDEIAQIEKSVWALEQTPSVTSFIKTLRGKSRTAPARATS